MNKIKKSVSFILIFLISISVSVSGFCSTDTDIILNEVSDYIKNTVPDPTVSSIGGEWAVFGLSRYDRESSKEYSDTYYQNLKKYLKNHNGVLDNRKYTEYSRVILALTAIGADPSNVDGINLLTPLGDYNKVTFQGLNGSIWALIALDSGNYQIPLNPSAEVQATRDMYISAILSAQNSDGGWAFSKDSSSEADITAMALCALSRYTDRNDILSAIEKALSFLSSIQNSDGGYSSGEIENSESCSQVLTALCQLKIPVSDSRFVKNGKTVFDCLLSYLSKYGGFFHSKTDKISNQMATEQAFYALTALKRFNEGKSALFDMSDSPRSDGFGRDSALGLPNKNPDVKTQPIKYSIAFSDTDSCAEREKIAALASRGIVSGKGDNIFDPNSTMTRAEFSAIITRGLGLSSIGRAIFDDVTENDWFYPYVYTAYKYGIINGVSDSEFNPNGTITKQEAAVMVCRAAKLCGMKTEYSENSVRDILAAFTDYTAADDWSRGALAFCYDSKILSDSDIEINPMHFVTRAEISEMLYNMLAYAELL